MAANLESKAALLLDIIFPALENMRSLATLVAGIHNKSFAIKFKALKFMELCSHHFKGSSLRSICSM